MADNVELDPGTGGAIIAGDDIGGVIYPRSKITLGADNSNDGDVSGSNPMPVKGTGTAGTANAGVVTVQGITSMTPVQVGDNSASLTVDAPVATPVFVRLSDGSDPITQLDVNIANMSPSLFSHAEDAASANAHIGVGSMAVRKATPANTSDTDGDYEFLQMSGGRLWVSAVLDTELPAGTQAIGKLAANNGVDIGDVTINNGSGAGAVYIQDGGNTITVDGTVTAVLGANVTEDGASAGGETLVLIGGTRNDAATAKTSGDGDYGTIALDAAGRVGIADLGGAITVDNGGTFAVQESGTHVQVDDAAFTPATSKICMIGAEVDEVATDSVDEGDGGAVRMSANRNMYVRIRDNAGNERGLNIDANGEFQISGTRNAIAVTDNSGALSVDWNGTTPVTGSGTATGALRVELPTNGTGTVGLNAGTNAIGKLAANSGVDIGDVDILSIAAGTNNIGNVGLIPRTSGGLTLYSNIDLDETKVQVKGSAGQVYWMHVMNMSNAPLYLKFWNLLAASVTVGTTAATMVIPIPTQGNTNGAGTQISIPQGLVFDTGITIACVTGVGTASSAGPGANELVISLGYA